MRLKLTLLCALLSPMMLFAQQNGEIDAKTLSKIKASYVKDVPTKALHNVIVGNKSLKALALNSDLNGKTDHNFKYRVTGNNTITDQQSSGRCWMFTSLNVFRPEVRTKFNISKFEFSHNYNYFWDMFEKSNLFLENIISTSKKNMDDREVVSFFATPINDGGVWNHFYNVSKKYGVVPTSVMPETEHSNNTSQLNSILIERLRKGGFEIRLAASKKQKESKLRDIKIETLKDVYRLLALCLGEPPVKFDWRFVDNSGKIQVKENYTPQQFFADIVPANYQPDNYIMIMNDPTRPYYKVYDIKNYRNVEEGTNWIYLNLPNEDIKMAALKSIKNNEPMYTSCDVGKELNMKAGVMDVGMYDYKSLLGIDLSMTKEARILTRQSGSAHAMTLVACDTDKNEKTTKWQFENSWGASSGAKGYLTFTDEWFNEYLFRIVIKKEYLGEKAIKALSGKVVTLPVWDYMF